MSECITCEGIKRLSLKSIRTVVASPRTHDKEAGRRWGGEAAGVAAAQHLAGDQRAAVTGSRAEQHAETGAPAGLCGSLTLGLRPLGGKYTYVREAGKTSSSIIFKVSILY